MEDLKVSLLIVSIVFTTVAIASIFGIRGLYSVLAFHTMVSTFAITYATIAMGKL